MSERTDDMDFQNEQLLIQEGLHRAKQQNLKLRPYGKCHNCEEKVGTGMVFCDSDCAEDHEKIRKAQEQRLYG